MLHKYKSGGFPAEVFKSGANSGGVVLLGNLVPGILYFSCT